VDEREAHFTWVEEHGVYDIQPRNGAIAPGDFLHVRPLAPMNVTFWEVVAAVMNPAIGEWIRLPPPL